MRRTFPSRLRLALACAALAANCGATPSPRPLFDREALERLRNHVERLAGDGMEGRGLGQAGLERATAYAADALREAGVATRLQPVPIVRYRIDPGSKIVLARAGTERVWHPGDGMLILHPGREDGDVVATEPAFVGYGISEPEHGRDDYAGIDVRGRIVFVLTGTPDDLPQSVRSTYEGVVTGPAAVYRAAVAHGAAAVVLVQEPRAFGAWDEMGRGRDRVSFAATRDYRDGRAADPPRPIVALDREAMSAVFEGSGFDPLTREGSMRSQVLEGVRLALVVDAEREPFESANVIGLVPGTDPSVAGEIVVLSAHIDHLGIIDGRIHNGANDDASGCAVVLELARRFVRAPARRPVAFALVTAEETQRLGSLQLLAEPPFDDGAVVAAVNLEHLGWSADHTVLAVTAPALEEPTRRIATGPGTGLLRLERLDPQGWNVFGNDGYSYFAYGVPLVLLENRRFPGYHTPDDDPEAVDFTLLADAASVTEALARDIADLEQGAPL